MLGTGFMHVGCDPFTKDSHLTRFLTLQARSLPCDPRTLTRGVDVSKSHLFCFLLLSYAPDGLQVKQIQDLTDRIDQSEIEIQFIPKVEGNREPGLLAVVKKDHPFFVKDKGLHFL